ncbi:hypothetical protein SERLA73DRAFT_182101 [Serpula lacrymans var. lacrymans S7.3]|uniref:Uncharacterized protein n=2 Tax=Serpula lacrymans var. lacrymans TaxID=341189 RepID=F8PZA5_SERL3|nr:uncharacterized protein SERLADRAFT_468599 [Serpula lacrymans var. lacrymans S7.9]EGN99218.1 hypothetical protein SERLA73DRAFT_182101 [Serpula lacrymans var. lacrymans S7.3]EGO24785.1 hypothetical protein SERLADRAFT_468599 [Serpula lacrymans var. lacrymans S7.9]
MSLPDGSALGVDVQTEDIFSNGISHMSLDHGNVVDGVVDGLRKPLHDDTSPAESNSSFVSSSSSAPVHFSPKPRRSKSASHRSISQLKTVLSDPSFHSPSQIVGTPFDIGPSPFEYPFPRGESPTTSEPNLPLSSSLPAAPVSHVAHSHSLPPINPPWAPLVSKSFPLIAPPPIKANLSSSHPKLRQGAVREPPIPPGLAKKRHQFSMSSQSRRTTDEIDEVPRGRRPSRFSQSDVDPQKQNGEESDVTYTPDTTELANPERFPVTDGTTNGDVVDANGEVKLPSPHRLVDGPQKNAQSPDIGKALSAISEGSGFHPTVSAFISLIFTLSFISMFLSVFAWVLKISLGS